VAQQAGDAFATMPLAPGLQLGVDAGRAVATAMGGVDGADD
jgi:hypothetical protein